MSEAHRKELNVLTSYRLNDFKKKAAFTLAEVLITLAIIGVVAAMTIPTLITKYQEKQTVSQLTKVYSTLASAYQMMTVEYGPINTWGLNPTNTGIIDEETGKTIYDRSGNDVFTERLRKYLRVSKICESGKVCYPGASYNIAGDKLTEANSVFNEGNDTSPSSNFFLHDGTFVAPGWYEGGSANASYWGTIYVVLPLGKDNILGKTKFYFRYNAKGLFPTGAKDDPAYRFEDSCDPSDHRTTSGQHCTAWVIYNKNMDYLHCRDKLSWEGAHSCKEAE